MSSTASPAIDLDCSPGPLHRAVSAAVLLMLLLVSSSMLLGPSAAPLTLFVGSISLAAVATGLSRFGWIGWRCPVRRATWTSTGLWYVAAADGHRYEAILQPYSRILPMMLWLHWRSGPLHFQALLFGADLSPDVRRRIRARIKFEAAAPAHAFEPPTS
jgi:hypothetical protein